MQTESSHASRARWGPGRLGRCLRVASVTMLMLTHGGCNLLFGDPDHEESSYDSEEEPTMSLDNGCPDPENMFLRTATNECACEEPGLKLVDGRCCDPSCDGMECGENDCGEACGYCSQPAVCADNQCCIGSCDGLECGNDGCGGSCGTCSTEETCEDGACTQAGSTCGSLTYEGCCDGLLLHWCEDGVPLVQTCESSCGWDSQDGYLCGGEGEDPSGEFALSCAGGCFGYCGAAAEVPDDCWCDKDCLSHGDCCANVCLACNFQDC
jgi:hypothetical protein